MKLYRFVLPKFQFPSAWRVPVSCGLALLLGMLYFQMRWVEVPAEAGMRKWQRGNVIHISYKGDGLVDEEITHYGGTRPDRVRRDTKREGYFDLEYVQGTNGLAVNLRSIHRSAPRH